MLSPPDMSPSTRRIAPAGSSAACSPTSSSILIPPSSGGPIMRFALPAILIALVAPLAVSAAASKETKSATPGYITAAMNDPARKDDAANDERRKAAAVLDFAKVKPGGKVLELVPGSGYWTRLFSAVVGPKGHVYTVWPKEMEKYSAKSLANWETLVKTAPYTNCLLYTSPSPRD